MQHQLKLEKKSKYSCSYQCIKDFKHVVEEIYFYEYFKIFFLSLKIIQYLQFNSSGSLR